MSSQGEEDAFSTDEENGHNMENFAMCSFAHHASSPRLQGLLKEEELCNAALACDFALDVFVPLSGLTEPWRLQVADESFVKRTCMLEVLVVLRSLLQRCVFFFKDVLQLLRRVS